MHDVAAALAARFGFLGSLMNSSKCALAATMALLAAGLFGNAVAGTSDVAVKGSVNPSPCALIITNGSIDYGQMTTSALLKLPETQSMIKLPERSVYLLAKCSAATRFAISFSDNRASSSYNAEYLGLGRHTGSSIGYYSVSVQGAAMLRKTPVGTPVASKSVLDTNSTPTAESLWKSSYKMTSGHWKGFSTVASATAPEALAEASMTLLVRAWVYTSTLRSTTDNIKLDGSNTITMMIL